MDDNRNTKGVDEMEPRITHAELEVMKLIWRAGEPMTFSAIRASLQRTMGWEKSTIQTLIRRLVDKGMLSAVRREVLYYSANLSEREYAAGEEQALIDRLYDGSAAHLVASLCRRGKLTERDLDELRAYFTMGGDGDGSLDDLQ